jgi:hypothetical protein
MYFWDSLCNNKSYVSNQITNPYDQITLEISSHWFIAYAVIFGSEILNSAGMPLMSWVIEEGDGEE